MCIDYTTQNTQLLYRNVEGVSIFKFMKRIAGNYLNKVIQGNYYDFLLNYMTQFANIEHIYTIT